MKFDENSSRVRSPLTDLLDGQSPAFMQYLFVSAKKRNSTFYVEFCFLLDNTDLTIAYYLFIYFHPTKSRQSSGNALLCAFAQYLFASAIKSTTLLGGAFFD